jgi:hypothetical protein
VHMFLWMCPGKNYILSLIQTPLYFLKLFSHFSILLRCSHISPYFGSSHPFIFSPNFAFFIKFAFTFIWMWYRHSKTVHLGKIVSTTFIRAWSRSETMTFKSSWLMLRKSCLSSLASKRQMLRCKSVSRSGTNKFNQRESIFVRLVSQIHDKHVGNILKSLIELGCALKYRSTFQCRKELRGYTSTCLQASTSWDVASLFLNPE